MMLYRAILATGLAAYAPYAFARESLGGKKVGDWRGRFGLSSLCDTRLHSVRLDPSPGGVDGGAGDVGSVR